MIRRGPIVFLFAAALLALSLPARGLAQTADETAAKEAYNEGIKQMQAGANDLAVTLFQTAIAKDPNLVDAYLNLGALFFQTKKYDEALEQFRKVTQKDPEKRGRIHQPGTSSEHLEAPRRSRRIVQSRTGVETG